MSKTKVKLLVGLAVLAIMLCNELCGWCNLYLGLGCTQSSSSTIRSEMKSLPATAGLRTYSDYAIVSEPTGFWKGKLQDELADELRHALETAQVSASLSGEKRQGQSFTRPVVGIYNSRQEALRHNPECMIVVKVLDWHYTPLPFYAKCKGKVIVKGGPPSVWNGMELHEARKDTLAYNFNIRMMPESSYTGLYTLLYPMHEYASEAAEETVAMMEKTIRDSITEARESSKQPLSTP